MTSGVGAYAVLSGMHIIDLYISDIFAMPRTSDGGNGNNSVLLPIIWIKIKVNQMLPSL